MKLTHLSLFSGIGGLDLAAEWAGIQTVGQCEWAEYPTKVLERHWPDVPRWKDIRTLTGESFYERTGRRTVDIISGGFPCQPFSVAGKQRGKEDDRYLWPEMVRVITELRPTWIIGENVAGIVRMALPDILSELEACGYRTRTFLIPACAVGARHRRYRVAIVGYSEHNGLSSAEITGGTQKTGGGQQEREKKTGKFTRTGKSRNYEYVANAYAERELQSTGNKQDIGNGIGNSCKTLANAEGQFEGRLPIRTKPKNPGFIISGKNVQHTNGTGRKELYTTAESDKRGSLAGDVMREMFATPQARDFRTGQASRWEDKEHRSRNLNDQIAMYPTPTTDCVSGRTRKYNQGGTPLTAAVQENGNGQLNPYWVEWLMGFPPGWTEI